MTTESTSRQAAPTDQHPTSLRGAVIVLERLMWTPGEEWRLAIEHLSTRLARTAPFDPSDVLGADTLGLQLDAIDEAVAAAGADVDVAGEITRFLDQHLSMHLKPDPSRTRALRAAAGRGVKLHGASALPQRAAEAIARHLGALRPLASMSGDVRSPAELTALCSRLQGVVATSLDEI